MAVSKLVSGFFAEAAMGNFELSIVAQRKKRDFHRRPMVGHALPVQLVVWFGRWRPRHREILMPWEGRCLEHGNSKLIVGRLGEDARRLKKEVFHGVDFSNFPNPGICRNK